MSLFKLQKKYTNKKTTTFTLWFKALARFSLAGGLQNHILKGEIIFKLKKTPRSEGFSKICPCQRSFKIPAN